MNIQHLEHIRRASQARDNLDKVWVENREANRRCIISTRDGEYFILLSMGYVSPVGYGWMFRQGYDLSDWSVYQMDPRDDECRPARLSPEVSLEILRRFGFCP